MWGQRWPGGMGPHALTRRSPRSWERQAGGSPKASGVGERGSAHTWISGFRPWTQRINMLFSDAHVVASY